MSVLVIIFGGTDHEFLERFDCPALKQAEWGPTVVDELYAQRDVATQITAQLITGKTWRDNGINGRRNLLLHYRKRWARFVEERVFRNMRKGRSRRSRIYQAFLAATDVSRNFTRHDLKCPCLFDLLPNSRAVYVPAYNPEPSWALDRNILDPRKYPELGVEGALDLREKNFQWRRRALLSAMRDGPYDLLVAQFQYIDSSQHLYLVYHDPPRMDLVEEAYLRMNQFAEEILVLARGKYDRVVFLSDNGAARKEEWRPTHHNRPFYSLSWEEGLQTPNLRDFFGYILDWVRLGSARGQGRDTNCHRTRA
jgi:hypothetical protein